MSDENNDMGKTPTQKTCSICGKSLPMESFSYGNRENRSYCRSCNQQDRAAYSKGGSEAARAFREEMRSRWSR